MVGAMTERLSADDIVDLARDNLRSPGPDRDAAYKKLIEENDVAFGVCRSNRRQGSRHANSPHQRVDFARGLRRDRVPMRP